MAGAEKNYNEKPVFCLTLDQEWASEDCLEDVLSRLEAWDCPATVFVTHSSAALSGHAAANRRLHLGLHPNFLPGSTHGGSEEEVLEHCFSLVPGADSFRSHAFYENTPLLRRLKARGIRYDSNLCLYLQTGLVPLAHCTGLIRFPVFWEDDVHFGRDGASWELRDYLDLFRAPGIKVLNFHPMNISLNVPSDSFYRKIKAGLDEKWRSVSAPDLASLAWEGPGTRTFLEQILDLIREEKLVLLNLRELHERCAKIGKP